MELCLRTSSWPNLISSCLSCLKGISFYHYKTDDVILPETNLPTSASLGNSHLTLILPSRSTRDAVSCRNTTTQTWLVFQDLLLACERKYPT